jgi:magnesium-transporting ATPase (P-type)
MVQSVCMALIGVGVGVPIMFEFYRFMPHDSGLSYTPTDARTVALAFYLLHLQLVLSLVCTSPVQCGLRFLQRRLVFLLCLLLVVIIFASLIVFTTLRFLGATLGYCAVVSGMQDLAKMGDALGVLPLQPLSLPPLCRPHDAT